MEKSIKWKDRFARLNVPIIFWGLLLLALLLSGTSQVKNSAKKLFARLRPSKEKELAGKVKS